MRQQDRPSHVQRIAALVLTAGLLLPAIGRAEEAPPDQAPPIETHWYDGTLRVADVSFDLLIIRPCSVLTLAAGSALFVPAAVLTAPNGLESILDAWERFVTEPGEYLWGRALGDL